MIGRKIALSRPINAIVKQPFHLIGWKTWEPDIQQNKRKRLNNPDNQNMPDPTKRWIGSLFFVMYKLYIIYACFCVMFQNCWVLKQVSIVFGVNISSLTRRVEIT